MDLMGLMGRNGTRGQRNKNMLLMQRFRGFAEALYGIFRTACVDILNRFFGFN
jgi:hypothetical protein